MQARVTYVYHSCFLLEMGGTTLLFDFAGGYCTQEGTRLVEATVKGADLWSFSSHAHGDHFSRSVFDLASKAKLSRFVLSSDIVVTGKGDRKDLSITQISADHSVIVDGVKVSALKSNDEGVAFIIEIKGVKVYFGGDLANWNWPEESTPEEMEEVEAYFASVVERLVKEKVNIAFSNTDTRLANWAGGAQLANRLKPALFVPVHLFGDTSALKRFAPELDPKVNAFIYKKTGDSIVVEV